MKPDQTNAKRLSTDRYAYLRKGERSEKVFTVFLRGACALISVSMVVGLCWFFLGDGVPDWWDKDTSGQHTIKMAIALCGFWMLTTTYAIKGDKALERIYARSRR